MTSLKEAMSAADMVRKLGRVGGFADGNYICNCLHCQKPFIGDKCASQCLPCAVDALKVGRGTAPCELES